MRILLADDNESLRLVLRKIIETEGWTVCGDAADGMQAVEQAQALKPDLIILDLAMPHLNGLQAAQRISNLLPGVPMLLNTLYDRQVVHDDAIRQGIALVIPKSDVNALIAAIKSFAQNTRVPGDSPPGAIELEKPAA